MEQGTIVWNALGTVNRAVYACRLGVSKKALPLLVLQRFDCFGPKEASTEDKLRSLLQEDYNNGCVVFSKYGFIHKRHYAQRAGCSNTQYYKELFEEFEAKLGEVRTKDLLFALLSRDFDEGRLKISRGGKIDRTHYAKQLGVTKSVLTTHLPTFHMFEAKLGGAKRYRHDDIQRMEEWLEARLAEGNLRVRPRGGLVRAQFKSAFSITHSDFEIRFREIGSLLERYDVLVDQRVASARAEAARSIEKETEAIDSISQIPSAPLIQTPSIPGAEGGRKPDRTARKSVVRAVDHPHDARLSTSAKEPIDATCILDWTDVAVESDISSGELRLVSDGGIDRGYYLTQALAAPSSMPENTYDRYSPDVANYHEQRTCEAAQNVTLQHLEAREPNVHNIDGCPNVAPPGDDAFDPDLAGQIERVNADGFSAAVQPQLIQDTACEKADGGEGAPPVTARHEQGDPQHVLVANARSVASKGRLRIPPKRSIARERATKIEQADLVEARQTFDEQAGAGDLPANVELELVAGRNTPPPDEGQFQLKTSLFSKHPGLRKHQFHEPGTTRFRLVSFLNEYFEDGGRVPIERKSLSKRLGITEASLHRSHMEVVRDYEAVARGQAGAAAPLSPIAVAVADRYSMLEKHQYYPLDSTKGCLVSILNDCVMRDGIPRSRGGKIDRRFLAHKLGVSPSAMAHYMDIIHDYEEETGGLESVHEAKIPEMRLWLDTSIADGTLETRDGKISRLEFYRRFDLGKNSLVLIRYPRIAALIEDYDRIVSSTGYHFNVIEAEIASLRAALDDNPVIFKTGLSYDRKALSLKTGISLGRIVRSPFIDLISKADGELCARVEADELCQIFAGRLFSFRELVGSGWSRKFLAGIASNFRKAFGRASQSDAKGAYNSLTEILRFLGASDKKSCRTVSLALNAGGVRLVAATDWTEATHQYAQYVSNDRNLTGAGPDAKLKSANMVIRRLSSLGALPELALPLRGPGGRSRHRRTIAEEVGTNGGDDYLAFAMLMLKEAAKTRNIEIEPNDEAGFLKTLRLEIKEGHVEADDNPASAILRVLKRRLALIENAFSEVYLRWRTHWDRGRELLAAGEKLGDGWEKLFVAGSRNEHRRRVDIRRHFPVDDPNRAVANLVRLIADHFGGIYPKNHGKLGQFMAKRALEFGGKPHIEGYVTPSNEAVGAALILYLAGSGNNIAVGRTLFLDAAEPSEISGCIHISGEKARAGGKPIHAHLETRSHAAQAMQWLVGALVGLRAEVKLDDSRLLFVGNFPTGPKPLEEYWLRDFFKRIVAGIPELANLGLTPSMLRPTVLLIAALEGDANAHIAAALGQHGLNVGKGYVDHPPTRFMHDEDIRKFFDNWETLTVHLEEDAQALLGVSKEELEMRVAALMETGLGTLCRDRNGRPGNDGAVCTQLDCWNNCPQLIVIARKQDLALMIIWRASLIKAEDDWIRDRPERWFTVWNPWLLFIQVVEEKIVLTSMGRLWREAQQVADKIMNHKNFRPWRPF
jgi:hypothetical protein